jgi:glycosyltransferase involved in cell wall biosynthesis
LFRFSDFALRISSLRILDDTSMHMNRLRVLHLIHHLDVGGAESLLCELLPRFDRAAFEMHAACLLYEGALAGLLRERGIPVHLLAKKAGPDVLAVGRLVRLLRRLQIDILNTHEFSAGLWGRLAAVLARTPAVVVTVHKEAGWQNPLKHALFNRLLLPRTDRMVAVSGRVAASLVRHERVPEDRIEVIENGIDASRFRSAEDRAACRARLGLPAGVPIAGMVARCRAEKGGRHFVEAAALLKKEGRHVLFVLVGDGPDLAEWKNLAASLGAADRLVFAGRQVDTPSWYTAFDVAVCPSLEESFGLSAIEAQAAGVPLVATRAGGLPDVLNDAVDALLVPPADTAALARGIAGILDAPALAARLWHAGIDNVASRFLIDRTVERYAGLYRRLGRGAGGRSS